MRLGEADEKDAFGREECAGQVGMREEARVECRWFYTTPIKEDNPDKLAEICLGKTWDATCSIEHSYVSLSPIPSGENHPPSFASSHCSQSICGYRPSEVDGMRRPFEFTFCRCPG